MTKREQPKEVWTQEAKAFRYAMGRREAEDQIDKLRSGKFLVYRRLADLVAQRIDDGNVVGPADLRPILDRKALSNIKAKTEAYSLAEVLTGDQDPEEGAKAYEQLQRSFDTDAQREELAGEVLDIAKGLKSGDIKPGEVTDRLRLAVREAARLDDQWHKVADLWQRAKDEAAKQRCLPSEAVMLRGARGGLAHWFNESFGPRGGLTAGRTVVLGGSPGAGKTSLGAMLAADALHAGCATLFWQLELGPVEALEHLMRQEASLSQKSGIDALGNVPDAWEKLLRIPCEAPDLSQFETIEREARAFASWCRRERARGTYTHEVNGLLVVDYAQLLTLKDPGAKSSQHDILCTICSKLAKLAAEEGMVLALLSQVTKESQKSGGGGMAAFSGGDIGRVAHVAFMINRATEKDDGTLEELKDGKKTKDARDRIIRREKERGTVRGGLTAEPGADGADGAPWQTFEAIADGGAIRVRPARTARHAPAADGRGSGREKPDDDDFFKDQFGDLND